MLKLYVWTGFSPDYTDGLAVAIASDPEHARKLVVVAHGYEPTDWGTLSIHELDVPVAFSVSGGG